MRLFHIRYDGYSQPVFASNFIAARRLGVCHLANTLGVVDTDKVAVVEADSAAGYKHGQPLFRAQQSNEALDLEMKKVLADHFLNDPVSDFKGYVRRGPEDEGGRLMYAVECSLHWFRVRVDNHLRHVLLKYGAIEPKSLADEVHVQKSKAQDDGRGGSTDEAHAPRP